MSGRILPEELIQDGGRPSARVELETYDGKALTWFEWIDMFRCLVHESGRPAGEKLALLKRSLMGPCQDIVYGLGGGEEAYKEALIRLKETCGRRDVMRTVHIKTINSLEPGRNPSSFKGYAEKIRTHLFDLTRSGVGRNLDIVEKVCAKLNLQDRLAWTEQKSDGASLNEFGRWLCKRATAYQNVHDIADEQLQSGSGYAGRAPPPQHPPRNQRRTFHTTTRTSFPKKGCTVCGQSHELEDCRTFKGF